MPLQSSPRTSATVGRQRFAADGVTTMSPSRLVVALYDRLLRDLAQGRRALDGGDLYAAHHALVHAQDILHELRTSLDLGAWDGAAALGRIYDFCIERVLKANLAKDAAMVAECERVLEPLRAAWSEALQSLSSNPNGPSA